MTALTEQVGGDHYRKMAIQPVQFAHANGYDPCTFSILKYVSRHREKGGVQDLRKAAHFVRLRSDLTRVYGRVRFHAHSAAPTIQDYIEKNVIPIREASTLRMNHWWGTAPDQAATKDITFMLAQLCTEIYGESL